MSAAAAAGRTGRFYTSARRHPWVLGKVADWKIPSARTRLRRSRSPSAAVSF
ncbi:hypothetical protein SAMN05216482_0055 [Streptomyces sp. PAN_FS17]|nr:hypothetical protein SAMN05216482_0055 [Streptomyces sp. PAN_FS17]